MNPSELLRHAQGLSAPPAGPSGSAPAEVDLRRAASAAYYALFHTLAAAGAQIIAPANDPLQNQVTRAFSHTAMRKVCDAYVRSPGQPFPPSAAHLNPSQPNKQLVNVAAAFTQLQEARHTADYDLSFTVLYTDAVRLVQTGESALADFAAIQALPETQVFLTALLLSDKWTRRG